MTRKPAYLAALASSAVPGLDPVAVRAARGLPGNRCDVAFVTDTQQRAWVIRVPTTPAAGAQLDAAVPLLGLISRRLPFQVPSPRGFVGVPEGRAVVYPFLHGRSVVLDETPPGPGVAAELGRAVAALHNIDRAVFEEAGVAVYDAETYRSRHLADLDRAAATGHVPTALLSRWERALEDVSAWRFAPTPVHGDIHGGRVLVSFAQEDDPSTATVRGVTGWEHAKVADPADDFAGFAEECSPETFESIVEAYALARIERPDRHLRLRARLASELRALGRLLDAVAAAEPLLITRRAAELRALDERTAGLPDLVPPAPVEPDVPARASAAPVATAVSGRPSHDPSGDESAGQPGAERDESEDTQRLLFGDAAEATTVIPDHELARLRAARGEDDETETETGADADVKAGSDPVEDEVLEVPVETSTAPDESWYQVIEPIDPPESDGDRTGSSAVEPTIVLVDQPSAATPEGRPDEAQDFHRGSEPASDPDSEPAPEPDSEPESASTPPTVEPPATRPARRHRRAQRP